MKFKFIIASLLAAVSFNAFADNQNVNIIDITGTEATSFNSKGTLFSTPVAGSTNGMDVISFSLAKGFYDFELFINSTTAKFDFGQSNLNGIFGIASESGGLSFKKKRYYFDMEGSNAESPFVLELYGSKVGSGPYSYTGNINVTAVPEPETYGMLMAGLGMLGFMARRKAAKKSV